MQSTQRHQRTCESRCGLSLTTPDGEPFIWGTHKSLDGRWQQTSSSASHTLVPMTKDFVWLLGYTVDTNDR